MKKFLIVLILLFSATLISGSISLKNNDKKVPVPLNSNPLTISINPVTNVKQGQTIFINIKTRYILENPYIVFDNNKIKIFKDNNGYHGLIGLDALEKTGKHKILITDDTHKLSEVKTINVISGKFPIQNIVISGSKSGLEATKYELARVQQAKYTLSNSNYWSINNDYLGKNLPPYNMPTKGCIISVYGLTRYHNGLPTGDFHKGLDIKAPQGQRINTIAAGKVLIAQQFRLHGGTVAVDHGQGLVSIYLHMSKIVVKEGQIIKTDQKIGEVGSTGFATGPHLHWGLYINGTPINPMDFWVKKVNKC